ncbi:MAG: hypothetical protein ACK2UL_03350 [Anaerolineae bacterium]
MSKTAEWGAMVVTVLVVLALAAGLAAAERVGLGGLSAHSELPDEAHGNAPGHLLQLPRGTDPDQLQAYNTAAVMEAATAVQLPLWRHRHTAARHSTAIVVMNTGAKPADVTITFRDSTGQPITDCGADCTATVDPSSAVYWWPPQMAGVGDRGDVSGSADVISTEPALAVVLDMSQAGAADMASYTGIGLGAEFPNSPTILHPLLLKNEKGIGGQDGAGSSLVQTYNVDRGQSADVVTSFFPWGSGQPVDISQTIAPRESELIGLLFSPLLADGPYSAIADAGQVVIASLSRSDWLDSGASVMGREATPGAVSVVPLALKLGGERGDLCTFVALQNPSRRAEVTYGIELYELGSSKAISTTSKVVAPARSAPLDLCKGNEFGDLPDGFEGSMRIVAPDSWLGAAYALTYSTVGSGAAGAVAQPASMADATQFAPLIHSQFPPDRRNPDMADLSSLLAVNNPGAEPVEVTVAYTGTLGTCAGQRFKHEQRTVPPRTSELFVPGPEGEGILPEGCVAAARIEATGGGVLAEVFDQGYPKQPTPTPTATATSTNTPTPVPTDTATATPTEVGSPTATATGPSSETPTSSATPVATTAEPTGRATNTGTPPEPTAPLETPEPGPTRVPPRDWTRVDRTNSLLPYDNVRYLEIDGEGGTWMRLIKPEGGPDAIVYVEPSGKWRVYEAGIKAAIARLPRAFLLGLRALRDFYDVDGGGRLWVGPEFHDGNGWQAVGTDVGGPGGGVRYDDRTLIDPAQQAWVPISTQLDCVPPQVCRADGLRAFGAGGDVMEDVQLRRGTGTAGHVVPDAQLITRRGRVPGGVVVSAASASSGGARALDDESAPSLAGSLDASPRVGVDAARSGFPGLDQATGDTEWIVTAGEYFVMPDAAPLYYPYLDPSDWLSTGLRNAGFATAATVSPSGQLQVITWLERDKGTTVQHQILLNTLADTGWLVEDLTGKGPLPPDVEFETVVGMDYCPDGALWLATAGGAIGVRSDGDRPDGAWTVYPEGSGVLEEGEVVSDIGCGPGGAVWIGTQSGLLGYGFEVPPVQIYIPSAEQTR